MNQERLRERGAQFLPFSYSQVLVTVLPSWEVRIVDELMSYQLTPSKPSPRAKERPSARSAWFCRLTCRTSHPEGGGRGSPAARLRHDAAGRAWGRRVRTARPATSVPRHDPWGNRQTPPHRRVTLSGSSFLSSLDAGAWTARTSPHREIASTSAASNHYSPLTKPTTSSSSASSRTPMLWRSSTDSEICRTPEVTIITTRSFTLSVDRGNIRLGGTGLRNFHSSKRHRGTLNLRPETGAALRRELRIGRRKLPMERLGFGPVSRGNNATSRTRRQIQRNKD